MVSYKYIGTDSKASVLFKCIQYEILYHDVVSIEEFTINKWSNHRILSQYAFFSFLLCIHRAQKIIYLSCPSH
jgi:hypothetical protein